MIDSKIQLVYSAGIALNTVALVSTAMAGDWILTVTFAVILVYLGVRFWMAGDQ